MLAEAGLTVAMESSTGRSLCEIRLHYYNPCSVSTNMAVYIQTLAVEVTLALIGHLSLCKVQLGNT